jgi:hypothetical protein
MAKVDREELRTLVRQALKEALGGGSGGIAKAATEPARPEAAGPPAPAKPRAGFAATLRAALAKGRPARVAVAVKSAEDVGRFARDIAEASGHPDLKAAILSGDIAFDITGTAASAAKAGPAAGAYEMTSGVLSETKIVEIARTHRKIVVGGDVVLTPLARDKAREMKVELTRQKP